MEIFLFLIDDKTHFSIRNEVVGKSVLYISNKKDL